MSEDKKPAGIDEGQTDMEPKADAELQPAPPTDAPTADPQQDTATEGQDDVARDAGVLDAQSKSAIVSCIHNLDKNNPAHFIGGKPNPAVLSEMCGFEVLDSDVAELWGDQNEPTEVTSSPAGGAADDDASSSYEPSPPIQAMREFERVMVGSRNPVLQQILREWQTGKGEACALDERLHKRGKF